VDVSVSGVGTRFPGVVLRGPLRLAKTTDVSELVPELDGVPAGESIFFAVSDPDQPAVTAAFGIWRGGFEWGRRVERPHGYTVRMQVAGLETSVRRARPISG
jgi:hypothetical protein